MVNDESGDEEETANDFDWQNEADWEAVKLTERKMIAKQWSTLVSWNDDDASKYRSAYTGDSRRTGFRRQKEAKDKAKEASKNRKITSYFQSAVPAIKEAQSDSDDESDEDTPTKKHFPYTDALLDEVISEFNAMNLLLLI